MQRRVEKKFSRMINIWIPLVELPQIDQAARSEDLDRSKFIRRAIREKLGRDGK